MEIDDFRYLDSFFKWSKKLTNDLSQTRIREERIDTVKYFLCKWDMKPHTHLQKQAVSSSCRAYQNLEQPPERLQNFEFQRQSNSLALNIGQIFLKKKKNIRLGVKLISLIFLKTFYTLFSINVSNFCRLCL